MLEVGGSFFAIASAWLWEWRWPLSFAALIAFGFQLRKARPAERAFATAMLIQFFLIIVAYWLLKPIKKAVFIGYYKTHPADWFGSVMEPAQMELLAKELNILTAVVAALTLSWLSRRHSGVRYSMTVTLTYFVSLIGFRIGMPDPNAAFAWAFYLFGDLFVTTMVAVFFSYLHEHSDVAGAQRLYGLIGLGGVLGGVVGSTIVSGLNQSMGASGALEACLVLLASIAALQWAARRLTPNEPRATYAANVILPEPISKWEMMSHGARIVLQSRHLKLIALVLFLYELASVVMDYQFTSAVTASIQPTQYRAYFSSVFAFSNALALLVQLLATTWILRRLGPQVALFVMPLAVLAGSGLYLAFPVLFFASLLNTADSAFAYSIQQTAREMAYVPLSRREKYEAKAFIDVVWLRFAKGIAVLASLIASMALPSERLWWLGLFVVALALVWIVVVRHLGLSLHSLSQARLSDVEEAASDVSSRKSSGSAA